MVSEGRGVFTRMTIVENLQMGAFVRDDRILEGVADIHGRSTTVLLVEQNASSALAFADRGYVMDSGEITMSGPARQLLANPKVQAAYLGRERLPYAPAGDEPAIAGSAAASAAADIGGECLT